VSVLHRRLASGNQSAPVLPYGTSATPMVMPIAHVAYEDMSLSYDEFHPIYFTGDVNAAPVAGTMAGTWGRVAPAGQP
jgi:hypothetical protein